MSRPDASTPSAPHQWAPSSTRQGKGLIRHGETDWNVQGCLQGQPDVPLNATGRRRAALMAARPARERFRFDAFYCSNPAHARDGLACRGALTRRVLRVSAASPTA